MTPGELIMDMDTVIAAARAEGREDFVQRLEDLRSLMEES